MGIKCTIDVLSILVMLVHDQAANANPLKQL